MDPTLLACLKVLGMAPAATEAEAKQFLAKLSNAQKGKVRQLCAVAGVAVPPEAAARPFAPSGPISLRSAGAFKTAKLQVDRDAGVIHGVSVIRKGPALGHGFQVDGTMLQQVADQINAKPKGVKSRLTHPGIPNCGGSDGIETLLGRVGNARVDGDQVLGDLTFGKYASRSPSGDLASYVMDVADEDPEIAGMSIVFEPDDPEEQPNPDPDDDEPLVFARSKDCTGCDLVGDPAANAAGMLARTPARVLSALPRDLLASWAVAAGLLSGDPAGAAIEIDRLLERVTAGRQQPAKTQSNPAGTAGTGNNDGPAGTVPGGVGPNAITLFRGTSMDPILLASLVMLGLAANADEAAAKQFLAKLSDPQKEKLRRLCAVSGAAVPPEAADPANPPPQQQHQSPPAQAPTLAQQRLAHLAEHKDRVEYLGVLATTYKLGEEWPAKAIVELADKPPAEFAQLASVAALKALTEKHRPADVHVGEDNNRGTLAAAMGDAVMLRAGNKLYEFDGDGKVVLSADGKPKERAPHPRTREFRNLSLMEMGKAHLHALGVKTVGLSRNEAAALCFNKGRLAGLIGTTFLSQSTGDFPGILGDTMHKSMRTAYQVAPVTWTQWAKMNTTPDFKMITRLQLSETNLRAVPAGGEYEESNLAESKETYKVSKYGRIISFNWESLVNDDLNAFGDVPRKMGNACRRKEDEVAYSPLLSNQVMTETGLPLFNGTVPVYKNGVMTTKGHNNLAANGTIVTVIALTAASTAMQTQLDLAGQDYLSILPKFIITSVQQQIAADQLMRSTADPATPNAGANNPFQGAFKVIGSPRITGTQWFLAADPDVYDTVEVSFLEGDAGPVFEEENGFDSDKRRFKVRHCVGARALDFRGLYKNPGQ